MGKSQPTQLPNYQNYQNTTKVKMTKILQHQWIIINLFKHPPIKIQLQMFEILSEKEKKMHTH